MKLFFRNWCIRITGQNYGYSCMDAVCPRQRGLEEVDRDPTSSEALTNTVPVAAPWVANTDGGGHGASCLPGERVILTHSPLSGWQEADLILLISLFSHRKLILKSHGSKEERTPMAACLSANGAVTNLQRRKMSKNCDQSPPKFKCTFLVLSTSICKNK